MSVAYAHSSSFCTDGAGSISLYTTGQVGEKNVLQSFVMFLESCGEDSVVVYADTYDDIVIFGRNNA